MWQRLVRGLMVAVLLAGMLAPAAHAADMPVTVVINEIYPGTSSEQKWVELYNTTDSPIDIGSWRLVRGVKDTGFANVFPKGTMLASHGFVLRESTDILPLNGGTAPLRLWSGPTGIEIDSATWPTLIRGQSYARTTDGGSTWGIAATPTPNATNVIAVVPPPVVPPVETPPVVVSPDPPPAIPPVVPTPPPVEEVPPALPPATPRPAPEIAPPVEAQPQYPAVTEVVAEPAPPQPGRGSVGTINQVVASVRTSQNFGTVVVATAHPAAETTVMPVRLPLNEPEDETDSGDELAVETTQPSADETEKTPAAPEPTDYFGVRWYWWFLAMLAPIGAVRFVRARQAGRVDAAQ